MVFSTSYGLGGLVAYPCKNESLGFLRPVEAFRLVLRIDLTLVSMILQCRTAISQHINDWLSSRFNLALFRSLICLTGTRPEFLSTPSRKNKSLLRLLKSALCIPPSRRDEGRIAIVTNAECGMRWTRRRAGRSAHVADGEVVWS